MLIRRNRLALFPFSVFIITRIRAQDKLSFNQYHNKTSLNMTLCKDKCTSDCKTYITPTNECFNSGELFPKDPSWSGLDILDVVICQTLVRTIFDSADGSCKSSDSDRFQIPLEECVGPFGQPRPWGTFSLESSSDAKSLFLDC